MCVFVCAQSLRAVCRFYRPPPCGHPSTPDINVGCVCFCEPANSAVCLSWSPRICTPSRVKPAKRVYSQLLSDRSLRPYVAFNITTSVLFAPKKQHMHANMLCSTSIRTHSDTRVLYCTNTRARNDSVLKSQTTHVLNRRS